MDSGVDGKTHGIVLAGSFPWSDSLLDRLSPRPLLPVALQPLISYALRWLRQGDVQDVSVCLNSDSRRTRRALAAGGHDFSGLRFHEDLTPRGPAGCARDAALASQADTFVVVDGTAIPTVTPGDVLQTHRASGAMATVVVQRELPREHGSPLSRPSGIYVFERRALELVPENGFQDIKENLIPQLYRAGEHVAAHVARPGSPRVLNIGTYLEVNYWAVAGLVEPSSALDGYVRCGEALIHASACVEPGARILGPVLIGADSRIMRQATVVGPLVIGTACTIAPGAVISRTVAWNRCVVHAKAIVDGCVLADDVVVDSNSHLRSEIRFAPRRQEKVARVRGARVWSIASLGLWPPREAR